MKTKQLLLGLSVAFALTACGSDNNDTPPIPEVVNTPPVATNDSATSLNSAELSIPVLANDSDEQGQTLTITAIAADPSHGSASISGSNIVYTANANYVGEDTLQYTISDGEFEASATVTISSTQSIMLSGVVTDGPVANATIEVQVGEETVSTTADGDGMYSLEVPINAVDQAIRIIGKGVDEQAQIELISFLGSSTELLPQRDDENAIASANVTHLSTAALLLARASNEGELFTTKEAYQIAAARVPVAQMIDVAAFIKLLVDNDDFVIPEGKTTVSLLSTDSEETFDAKDIEDAIQQYFVDAGITDENGNLTSESQTAFEAARKATIEDPAIGKPLLAEDLNGKQFLLSFSEFNYASHTDFPRNAESYSFNADGTGLYSNATMNNNGNDIQQHAYAWTINDHGELDIEFTDEAEVFEFYIPVAALRAEFGDAAAEAFIEIYGDSQGEELTFTYGLTQQSIKVLDQVNERMRLNRKYQSAWNVVFNAGTDAEQQFPLVNDSESYASFIIDENANTLFDLEEQLAGTTWALPVYGIFTEDGLYAGERNTQSPYADIISLNADGTATAKISGVEFDWRVADDKIIYETRADDGYSISLSLQTKDHDEYAFIAQWSDKANEDNNFMFSGSMAKVSMEDSLANAFEFADLTSDIPLVWASALNASMEEDGNPNKPNGIAFENIYSFHFQNDGVTSTIEPQSADDIGGAYFKRYHSGWNWTTSQVDDSLHIAADVAVFGEKRQRRWTPISTVEREGDTFIYVLERDALFVDSDGDGQPDQNTFLIRPRVNIYKQIDISLYEEEYAESQKRESLKL